MTRLLALVGVCVALAGLGRVAATEVIGQAHTRASDALPLYLSAGAVAAGLDPTREASLAQVYDARDLSVGAATFSTLYPATAGVVLRPFAALEWLSFTTVWRWILLAAVASYGVSVAAVRRGWAGVAWGGAVVAVLAWHPVTAECVRLGQVNMALGALCAGAMAAVVRGGVWSERVAGVALALGGAIKLVPATLLLPLLASGRWRAPAIVAGLAAVALAAAVPTVSLVRIVEAVGETLRFQGAIDPDWLVGRNPAPAWMRVLGYVRHDPLQWITLALVVGVPALRPSPQVSCAAMGLLTAWLGADAAGFHVLYAPLAYPVFLLVAGRPALFGLLTAIFYAMAYAPSGIGAEPRMVLFGLAAWGATAGLLWIEAARLPAHALEADGEVTQAGIAVLGVATGFLLVSSVPGEGPVAEALPEGQTTPDGPGFIRPRDRVPGEVRALGAGMERPASTLARPGSIRALQLHMRRAPIVWAELAARYPARRALLRARVDAAPTGDLRDRSGREIADWLLAEEATVKQLQAEGLDLADILSSLSQALVSGLTDPGLPERLRGSEE